MAAISIDKELMELEEIESKIEKLIGELDTLTEVLRCIASIV